MAPSSSGSEYSTTDCRPAMPSRVHDAMSWISSGAATTYGMFLDARMPLATSAWRPPSMLPAGPPTSGKPIVEMTASTVAASRVRSVGLMPPVMPFARLACSCCVVSRSRTTVWASTPLMKIGTGTTPSPSIWRTSCSMYGCSVTTCLRYSSTAATGASGRPRNGPSRRYHAMYCAGVSKYSLPPRYAGCRQPSAGVSTTGSGGATAGCSR
mmetsp:Transcript_8910/g.27041  ORF Transcript_8910/g.27041 Transcript_8910/m.27041 type:complete len:211 (+) Transcript_8910:275-907(+)